MRVLFTCCRLCFEFSLSLRVVAKTILHLCNRQNVAVVCSTMCEPVQLSIDCHRTRVNTEKLVKMNANDRTCAHARNQASCCKCILSNFCRLSESSFCNVFSSETALPIRRTNSTQVVRQIHSFAFLLTQHEQRAHIPSFYRWHSCGCETSEAKDLFCLSSPASNSVRCET